MVIIFFEKDMYATYLELSVLVSSYFYRYDNLNLWICYWIGVIYAIIPTNFEEYR